VIHLARPQHDRLIARLVIERVDLLGPSASNQTSTRLCGTRRETRENGMAAALRPGVDRACDRDEIRPR
jgi:hypothetical protein